MLVERECRFWCNVLVKYQQRLVPMALIRLPGRFGELDASDEEALYVPLVAVWFVLAEEFAGATKAVQGVGNVSALLPCGRLEIVSERVPDPSRDLRLLHFGINPDFAPPSCGIRLRGTQNQRVVSSRLG